MGMVMREGNVGFQPRYLIIEEKNVFVPMRDGISLAVDVFCPDTEGRFPALLSLSPFGKGIQAAIPPQGPESYFSYGALDAGNTNYIVSRRYVHVVGDIRGTGKSEGKYKCICFPGRRPTTATIL